MSSSRRPKSDKWRNLLKQAEALNQQKQAELEQLLQQKEVLKWRQEAVNQIVDSVAAITFTMAQAQCSDPEWLAVQQHLQSCLHTVGGEQRGCTLRPHTLSYIQTVFNPHFVHKVLAMTNKAIMDRVRAAMGKCAIMVVQKQAAAAWEQPQQGPATVAYLHAQLPPGYGHPALYGNSQRGGQSTTTTTSAGASSGLLYDSSAAHTNDAAAALRSIGLPSPCHQLGPAFEVSGIWGVLFNFDVARFLQIISQDLETSRELKLDHGPSFGRWLASMLALTAEQVAVLKGLRDLVRQQHEALPDKIMETTLQQQMLTQQQQQQQHWTNSFGSAEQVHAAHEQVLQQQADALRRFRLMAKFMGLVTLNTLTPSQLATLHACSWPAVCRIEPVLDVLDDLTPTAAGQA